MRKKCGSQCRPDNRSYVEAEASRISEGKRASEKSWERKSKYEANWVKRKVNINEIVDKFAPDFAERVENSKFIFQGESYNVIADMASGYLRIWDKSARMYTTIDGTPCKDADLTHFKIYKREEM